MFNAVSVLFLMSRKAPKISKQSEIRSTIDEIPSNFGSDHCILQLFARPKIRAWFRDPFLDKNLYFEPNLKICLRCFFAHVPHTNLHTAGGDRASARARARARRRVFVSVIWLASGPEARRKDRVSSRSIGPRSNRPDWTAASRCKGCIEVLPWTGTRSGGILLAWFVDGGLELLDHSSWLRLQHLP